MSPTLFRRGLFGLVALLTVAVPRHAFAQG